MTDALRGLGLRKLHPSVGDAALFGGLDLGATLAMGGVQSHAGLLAHHGALVLSMAERCPAGLAARLGQALDARPALSLVALDEAVEEGEGLPAGLADRLGLFLDLDGFAFADAAPIRLDTRAIAAARAGLSRVDTGAGLARLARVAAELGIASLRAPLLALACARAQAAWRGADVLSDADLRVAVTLCLAHRATQAPAEEEESADEAPPEPPQDQNPGEQDTQSTIPDLPEEMLVAAARAALPPGLLAQLQAARVARQAGAQNSGMGAARKSMRRGRPLPSRAGKPGAGARVDVIATLRQAAPFQKMRAEMFAHRPAGRLAILPSDLRIRRYQDRTDRVLIFVVDASGSAAVARLAEAKGAVELMLSEAYASRDHVALISFRGAFAELSLPPTRSLVQTKRRLAGLPGGGATPLASALDLGLATALRARRSGMAPTLALLTDGRGNIALDGRADRAQAAEDMGRLARAIAAAGLPGLVIDTSLRPKSQPRELAHAMGARLIALPRADARALSRTLGAALGG